MKNNIAILFLLSFFCLTAQHKQFERVHEVGFGLGALNYTGDLSEYIKLKNTKPQINFFYRHNSRNEVSVFRTNLRIGGLGADESKSSEPLRNARGLGFSGTLIELAQMYEYDFFDFRDINNKYYMSPFLFGGVSLNTFVGDNPLTFVGIPFGAGIKFRLHGGWNIGAELGASKNFTDKLDGQEDEVLLGAGILTDWHYQLGINLSYTFYHLVCAKDVSKHVKQK